MIAFQRYLYCKMTIKPWLLAGEGGGRYMCFNLHRMPLGAGFIRWVLACSTIKKKKRKSSPDSSWSKIFWGCLPLNENNWIHFFYCHSNICIVQIRNLSSLLMHFDYYWIIWKTLLSSKWQKEFWTIHL